MVRSKTRTQSCDRSDALTRLTQSESFLLAAELVVDDDSDDATPSVAASLAVLAGIVVSSAEAGRMVGWAKRLLSHAHRAVEA
jgi:hypothetical protein